MNTKLTFRALVFLGLLSFSSVSFAYTSIIEPRPQTVTEIVQNQIDSGVYGAPVMKLTSAFEQTVFLAGAKAAWIVNHNFNFGGAGYGLLSQTPNNLPADQNAEPTLSYGGLFAEYHLLPENLVSYSGGLLLGMGNIKSYYDEEHLKVRRRASMFVIEPEANVYVRMHELVRAGLGLSYRLAIMPNSLTATVKGSEASGLSLGMLVQVGLF